MNKEDIKKDPVKYLDYIVEECPEAFDRFLDNYLYIDNKEWKE